MWCRSIVAGVLILGLSVPAQSLPAAELTVHYTAMRTFLLEQVFTDQGRHYLTGSPRSHCQYAFLTDPRVTAQGERLRITAHLTSRAAVELGDSCFGPQETVEVSVTGIPRYREGTLYLDQVELEAAESLYVEVVQALLGDALSHALRYPLLSEVQTLARQASAQSRYDISVSNLRVDAIRVAPEATVFSFDFRMDVR